MTTPNPTVIFILGAPGSAKGTPSTILAHGYWLRHISLGDHWRDILLNARIGQGLNQWQPLIESSRAVKSIKQLGGLSLVVYTEYMNERELLPTNAVMGILRMKVADYDETGLRRGFKKVVIDGFTRTLASAKAWDEEYSRSAKLLVFNCPADIALQRFKDRGRSVDDNAEVFAKRYEEYERLNGEIVEHYKDLVVEIDTSRKTEESYDLLLESIQTDPVLQAFCSEEMYAHRKVDRLR